MTKEEKTKIIIDIVNDKPGLNGVKLMTEFVKERYNQSDPDILHEIYGDDDTPVNKDENTTDSDLALVNELVQQGELVEVEYVLQVMNYRAKSLYFPKGTLVKIVCP